MKKTFESHSERETKDIARSLADIARGRGYVCLTGGLGAGKTAFTAGLVEALCPECSALVHSPTFAIVNEYLGKDVSVFHFDLYRIRSSDDLYSTGFYDYEDRKGVIVAEWSDMFPECFPADALKVEIEVKSETERTINVEYGD